MPTESQDRFLLMKDLQKQIRSKRTVQAHETGGDVRSLFRDMEWCLGLSRQVDPLTVFQDEAYGVDAGRVDRVRVVVCGVNQYKNPNEWKFNRKDLENVGRHAVQRYEVEIGPAFGVCADGLCFDFDDPIICPTTEGELEALVEKVHDFDLMMVSRDLKRLERHAKAYRKRWGDGPYHEYIAQRGMGPKACRLRAIVAGDHTRLEVLEVVFRPRLRVPMRVIGPSVDTPLDPDAYVGPQLRYARARRGHVILPNEATSEVCYLVDLFAKTYKGRESDHWPIQHGGALDTVTMEAPCDVVTPLVEWHALGTRPWTSFPEQGCHVGMGLQFNPRQSCGPSPFRGMIEGRRLGGTYDWSTAPRRVLVDLALHGMFEEPSRSRDAEVPVAPTMAFLLDHQWYDSNFTKVCSTDVSITAVGVGQSNMGSLDEFGGLVRSDFYCVVQDTAIADRVVGQGQDGGTATFGPTILVVSPTVRPRREGHATAKRHVAYKKDVKHRDTLELFKDMFDVDDLDPGNIPVEPPAADPVTRIFQQMEALYRWHGYGKAPTLDDARRLWLGEPASSFDGFCMTAGLGAIGGRFGWLSSKQMPILTDEQVAIFIECGAAVIRATNRGCPGTDVDESIRVRRPDAPLLVGPLLGEGDGVVDRPSRRITTGPRGLLLWVNATQHFEVDSSYHEALVASVRDYRSAPYGRLPLPKLFAERTPDLHGLDEALRRIRGYMATEPERELYRSRHALDADVQMQMRVSVTGWVLYFEAVRKACRQLGIQVDTYDLSHTVRF